MRRYDTRGQLEELDLGEPKGLSDAFRVHTHLKRVAGPRNGTDALEGIALRRFFVPARDRRPGRHDVTNSLHAFS